MLVVARAAVGARALPAPVMAAVRAAVGALVLPAPMLVALPGRFLLGWMPLHCWLVLRSVLRPSCGKEAADQRVSQGHPSGLPAKHSTAVHFIATSAQLQTNRGAL